MNTMFDRFSIGKLLPRIFSSRIKFGYSSIGPSRQTYTTANGSTVSRLVRSSSQSGVIEEYDGQGVMYSRSPNNSATVVFDGNNYNFDENTSRVPVLTEDMLIRSHSTSGGKFPTHLLTKLGSQIYDMPSDQVDLSNTSARTTTTTRYYTTNQGESADETGEFVPRYTEEKYVQIKASDLKDVLANYDVFSSTGQKLEGEQITF